LIGKPRNIKDPHLFHKLALIPILAWIGLGGDELSYSSYGPEEAFKTLGSHTYLALFLALATALTVLIISCGAAVFSFFPADWQSYKIPFDLCPIVLLVVLNLRGVKESVTALTPIFIIFVVSHLFLIG